MAKQSSSDSFLGGLSESRKMEILGILVMAVGGLLGFSIVTYNPADYTLIQSLSTDSIFALDQGPALRIQNGLGVVGAYLLFCPSDVWIYEYHHAAYYRGIRLVYF